MKTFILTLAAVMSLAVNAQVTYMHVHKGTIPNNIIVPENQTASKGNGGTSTYSESNLTNFWVTNGGICRTVKVDEEGVKDVTLDVMIDNDSNKTKENEFGKIKNMMQRTEFPDGWYVSVPVEFDVNGDESIVDHYELCGYNHLKNNTYPIMFATDDDWSGSRNLVIATQNPTNTMRIEKQGGDGFHHYDCYKINASNPVNLKTGYPNYSTVPLYKTEAASSGDIVLTIYIKVYYNNGLEPTYHSLNNVKYSIQKIITAVEDINIEDAQPVYYDLMGNEVVNPEGGIFIKKVGNKTTKVRL